MLLVSLLASGPESAEAVEAEVVASMYRSGWWEFYQRPRPETVPSTFREGPGVITDVDGLPGGPRLVHQVVAAALRALNVRDVETQYWTMRAIAAVCAIVTLVIAWYANRAAFGPDIGAASAAAMALHPQYLLVAVTANPDAAVLVLGAIFWAAIVSAVRGGNVWMAAGTGGAAAALGGLIRRVAFPLLVDAAVIGACFLLAAKRYRRPAAAAVAFILALVAVVTVRAPGHVRAAVDWSIGAVNVQGAMQVLIDDPRFALTLAEGLFQSFWLTAGWGRFPAPSYWYVLVTTLSLLALGGCIRFSARAPDGSSRYAFQIASMLVVVQVVAIFVMHLPIRTGAQGRYLMPVALPLFGLLAMGVLHAFPTRWRTGWSGVAVVIAMFGLIDGLAWALVLFPAYWPR